MCQLYHKNCTYSQLRNTLFAWTYHCKMCCVVCYGLDGMSGNVDSLYFVLKSGCQVDVSGPPSRYPELRSPPRSLPPLNNELEPRQLRNNKRTELVGPRMGKCITRRGRGGALQMRHGLLFKTMSRVELNQCQKSLCSSAIL